MPEAGLNCIVCLREETTTPWRPAALIRAGRLDEPPPDWCRSSGSRSVRAPSNVLNSRSWRWWHKVTINNNAESLRRANAGFHRPSPCLPVVHAFHVLTLCQGRSAGHRVVHPSPCTETKLGPRGDGRRPARVTRAASGRSSPHFPQKAGFVSKAATCIPPQPAWGGLAGWPSGSPEPGHTWHTVSPQGDTYPITKQIVNKLWAAER